MVLLTELNFNLPLTNPVIIFSLVLFIILFAPLLFQKIKVPPIIGLIVAGVIVGPHGFNLLLRDSSIVLFGTVGLLYIMLTAGLEIDLHEFKKNLFKSLAFGLYTFIVPMLIGSFAIYYLLGYSLAAAILISSMFSSHTLLAYPIASRYGIANKKAVTLTVGGTIITDVLSLLVLAAVLGTTKGNIAPAFWIKLSVSTVILVAIIILGFPIIARWFFKKFDDSISQYIFVLAMVFLGSFLAEVAGLEAIIGAFLSGLALNRFIPHTSPLMNRIQFVGNALFIPFFLIGVGMLVDFKILLKGFGALKVAGVMIVLAVATKFIAAWLTQKTFKLSQVERQLIFGLSTARVGATLAVVLVGYNVILGETASGDPIRLLDEDILNGTILMILATCTISSFISEKASRKIALLNEVADEVVKDVSTEKILISIAYPENVNNLVDLAYLLQPNKDKSPLYALHVVDDQDEAGKLSSAGKKMMEHAITYAAATDNKIIPINRYDVNISNGIVYTIKEYAISDIVMGMHHNVNKGEEFWGSVTEKLLHRTAETIFIFKASQPINTLKRIAVVVPPNAKHEQGFQHWFLRVKNIAKETGLPLFMYADNETISPIKMFNYSQSNPVAISFIPYNGWSAYFGFSQEVNTDDLFIIVSSRKGQLSYNDQLSKLPDFLTRKFENVSYIIVYPAQLQDSTFDDLTTIEENVLEKATKYVKKIFRRKHND